MHGKSSPAQTSVFLLPLPHFCTLRLARRQPINISGKYLSLPSVVLLHLFCPFRDGRDDSQEGLNRTRKCKLVTHCHRRNFFMNCSCQRRAVAVGRERHAFVNWPLFLIYPHLSGELRSYPLVKFLPALLSAWIRHIADKNIFKSCRYFTPFPLVVFPHGDLISIYFMPRKSTRSAHYVPSFLSHRHSRHASLRAPCSVRRASSAAGRTRTRRRPLPCRRRRGAGRAHRPSARPGRRSLLSSSLGLSCGAAATSVRGGRQHRKGEKSCSSAVGSGGVIWGELRLRQMNDCSYSPL